MPRNGETSRKQGDLGNSTANAKKEICKCCRKDLGLLVRNIAMFRGKCQTCRQKICSSCVTNNFCHKCRVKNLVKLTPTNLMQLPGKQLLEVAKMLHFHNPQSYEKSELVQLILAIYGLTWTRPIPQPPSSADSPNVHRQGGQPLGKCQHCERDALQGDLKDSFCHRCDVIVRHKYDPETLMQLSGKDLQSVLESLDVPKSELTGLEKGELVKLVLKTIGRCEDWNPPVPPQPSARPRSVDIEPHSETVISSSTNVPGQANSNDIESPTESVFARSSGNGGTDSPVTPNESLFTQSRPLVPESERNQQADSDVDLGRLLGSNIVNLEDIPSVEAVQELKAWQLKAILQQSGIDIVGCCEKKDLADQVVQLWTSRFGIQEMDCISTINQRLDSPISSEEEPVSSTTDTVPMQVDENDSKSNTKRRRIIILPGQIPSLRNMDSPEEIEHLSNQILMAILQKHSVNYSTCKERTELLQLVTQLWNDVKKRGSCENIADGDLCKICMDAAIDCVLLECGHMVACTECGRQLSECPICRQYVIRVVHTFKT